MTDIEAEPLAEQPDELRRAAWAWLEKRKAEEKDRKPETCIVSSRKEAQEGRKKKRKMEWGKG